MKSSTPMGASPKRLMTLTLGVFLLACCFPAFVASKEHDVAESDSEEHISDVLQHTVTDVYETVRKSENPVADLKKKYSESVKKLAVGGIVGYVAGAVVKYLSLSIIKAAVIGSIGFVALLATGVIGKDNSIIAKQVDEILEGMHKFDTSKAEKIAKKTLDINKDGKVNLKDLREMWLRAERAVMKNNLPLSLGGIIGVCTGLYR